MTEVVFAVGALLGPRQDQPGEAVRFGIVQNVSVDFATDVKDLIGQNRHPTMHAQAKTKVDIKAGFASISARLFNELFFGASLASTTITIGNMRMGEGPLFALMLANSAFGTEGLWLFPACRSSKLSLPLRQDDYTLPALDISAAADGSGSIATASFIPVIDADLSAGMFDLSVPEWSGFNDIMGIS